MKFKARVAVIRDGREIYYAKADVARRMCQTGMAMRRGQNAIELPGQGSEPQQNIAALAAFAEAQPEQRCYGAHTTPNQDRLSYAPCLYRAGTGRSKAILTTWIRPN